MMSILSDNDIRVLCADDPPLLADFLDFEKQLQPTGFDITLRSITMLKGGAQVGGLPKQSGKRNACHRERRILYTHARNALSVY